jgi:uncharacterized protein (DUF1330 family)
VSVYAIAQLTVHDRARYLRYAERVAAAIGRHGGRVLAADDSPRSIEGTLTHARVVLLEFPNAATFESWYRSDEYQEIAKDRFASTEGTVTLVRGLPQR